MSDPTGPTPSPPEPAPLPPDQTTLIPTSKGLIDATWNLNADKSMVDQFATIGGKPSDRGSGYMTWMDFILLAMLGNYFNQWLFGGIDAPSPLAIEATTFDIEAWKKSHPANHLNGNPIISIEPGFVDKLKSGVHR